MRRVINWCEKTMKKKLMTNEPLTGNLSKAKRNRLIEEIGEIRAFLEKSAGADKNASRLLRFAAEVEKEVRGRKYGLVFEEHREMVDEGLVHNVPVLTEVKEMFVSHGDSKEQSINFLIEGDNLSALKLLEKTHRGKIDLIYIDPPYNTGNKDFRYNDEFVEKTDTFRHSKWLSFMQKRLEIARRLMSDKGVIFISIDDNEQAALKLLCDDVFRDTNFVGTYFWKRTNTPPALSHKIRRKLEYVICYQKGEIKKRKFSQGLVDGGDAPILNSGNPIGRLIFPAGTVHFRIPDGEYENCKGMKIKLIGKVVVRDGVNAKEFSAEAHFKWGQNNLEMELDNGTYLLVKSKKFSMRYQKSSKSQKVPSNIIDGEVGVETNEDAQKELEGLNIDFEYAKPTTLIKYLIKMPYFNNESVTVLDFFAGSGTTGHAVMKLNAEDGGKRKFILVTNNENRICEKVTYERLKRVIKRDKFNAAVKYFKVEYIPIDGKVYYDYADNLLKHIRELVELENAIDFKTDSTIAIAVTDKEFEKFVSNDKKMIGKQVLYIGHDVLISKQARQKLERMGIEIRIIPQYYYSEQEA